MRQDTISAAAAVLKNCRDTGTRISSLSDELRPMTRADGYAIQAVIEKQTAVPLFGWKIAATSPAGQAHINVDGPMAGRIVAERVVANGEICPFGANLMCVAEVEFAFRMGHALTPQYQPYTVNAVLEAVATLHPAIEIPDSRFEPFEAAGAPQLIADNACASYFILGPAAPEGWRSIDLATHRATGRVNDGPLQPGIGSNVLGDPRVALTWLANELSSLGILLKAGQVVTTGTCVLPMVIAPGDRIIGDLGAIGRVSVQMADR